MCQGWERLGGKASWQPKSVSTCHEEAARQTNKASAYKMNQKEKANGKQNEKERDKQTES